MQGADPTRFATSTHRPVRATEASSAYSRICPRETPARAVEAARFRSAMEGRLHRYRTFSCGERPTATSRCLMRR